MLPKPMKLAIQALMVPAAAFYLFVLPMLVAGDPGGYGISGILFGLFLFAQLWTLIWLYAMQAAAAFYGLRQPRIAKFFLERTLRDEYGSAATGWEVILLMFLSYAFTVHAFGIAFIFISGVDPSAFSTEKALSFVDGLYFSVITAATVGYGDIVPKSSAAKIAVMFEVGVSLVYVVLLFSIASSYARDLKARSDKRPVDQ